MSNRIASVAAAFSIALLSAGCGGSDETDTCAPVSESCNGADDDCDGEIDEAGATGCTWWYEDADSDGFGGSAACLCSAAAPHTSATGGDCDDEAPGVHPEATETCDGVDEDCDALTDEGIAGCCEPAAQQGCGVSEGVCTVGTSTCGADFAWGACLDGPGAPVTLPGELAEACNGDDDDCDGAADEALSLACYSGPADTLGVGLCAAGTQHCTGGAWGACEGEVVPVAELCDGLDDDCDGVVDEGLGGPPCANQAGVCASSTMSCGGASGWLACNAATYESHDPAYQTGETLCDGLDNDCDGVVDEGLGAPLCAKQEGVCAGSTQTCGGTSGWLPCTDATYEAHDPAYDANSYDLEERLCDDLDNDCDGAVDDGCDKDDDDYCTWTVVGTPAVCPLGGGDCIDTSTTWHPGAPETCGDGYDTDCDGSGAQDEPGCL